MCSSIINGMHDRINAIEYGLANPHSLIVLIPIVAQYAQHVQLQNIPRPTTPDMVMEFHCRADPINIYHCLGGLARSVFWIALALFTGIGDLALCAIPALYQMYYSQQRLTAVYTVHPDGSIQYLSY